MSIINLMKKLPQHLNSDNFDKSLEEVTKALRGMPLSPFHIVLDVDFTNNPADIAGHFDKFLKREKKRYKVSAVYTETNGFDINPKCWYFDVFAYESYGGHKDYEWISDWQSDDFDQMILTGMEKLQKVYASGAFREDKYQDTIEVVSLIVVLKFQKLIKNSVPLMKELKCPILATGHEYDYMYEFDK
ncbi:MAG: hypothetical protein WC980_07965 [Candidatus Brocadiia bacterium]